MNFCISGHINTGFLALYTYDFLFLVTFLYGVFWTIQIMTFAILSYFFTGFFNNLKLWLYPAIHDSNELHESCPWFIYYICRLISHCLRLYQQMQPNIWLVYEWKQSDWLFDHRWGYWLLVELWCLGNQ